MCYEHKFKTKLWDETHSSSTSWHTRPQHPNFAIHVTWFSWLPVFLLEGSVYQQSAIMQQLTQWGCTWLPWPHFTDLAASSVKPSVLLYFLPALHWRDRVILLFLYFCTISVFCIVLHPLFPPRSSCTFCLHMIDVTGSSSILFLFSRQQLAAIISKVGALLKSVALTIVPH